MLMKPNWRAVRELKGGAALFDFRLGFLSLSREERRGEARKYVTGVPYRTSSAGWKVL